MPNKVAPELSDACRNSVDIFAIRRATKLLNNLRETLVPALLVCCAGRGRAVSAEDPKEIVVCIVSVPTLAATCPRKAKVSSELQRRTQCVYGRCSIERSTKGTRTSNTHASEVLVRACVIIADTTSRLISAQRLRGINVVAVSQRLVASRDVGQVVRVVAEVVKLCQGTVVRLVV
jgi:hypothetical protein